MRAARIWIWKMLRARSLGLPPAYPGWPPLSGGHQPTFARQTVVVGVAVHTVTSVSLLRG